MASPDLSDLPPGFRFVPTDQELLVFYLRRKTAGLEIAPAVDSAIPTLDLFVPGAAPPWLLHPAAPSCASPPFSSLYSNSIARSVAPRDATEWFYCFARTTPRGSGSCRATASGTWLTSGGDKRVKVPGRGTVGYKSTLAFKIPGSGVKWVGTNWVMHEFKIHGERKGAKKSHGDGSCSSSEEEELVLCRIRCTKRMEREEGSGVGRALQSDEVVSRQKRRRTSGPAELPGASVGGCGEWVSCCLQGDPLASGMLEQPAMSREDLWGGVDWGPVGVEQDHNGDWHLVMAEGNGQSSFVVPFEQGSQSHGFESFVEQVLGPATPADLYWPAFSVDTSEVPGASIGNAGCDGGRWNPSSSWAVEAAAVLGIDMGAVPIASPAPPNSALESAATYCLQEGPLSQGVLELPAMSEEDLWDGIDWGFITAAMDHHGGDWQLVMAEGDNQSFSVGTPEAGAGLVEPGLGGHGSVSFVEQGLPAGAAAPDATATAADLDWPESSCMPTLWSP